MSHIVKIQTEVRDPAAIRRACKRLRIPPPATGRFQLFNEEIEGLGINLPEWRFPIVCETSSGQVRYDNFNGRWGHQKELDRFLQRYAVEKTLIEASRNGHRVTENQLPDGAIKLTLHVGDYQ